MNELTQLLGLEYGVKMYINRSDIFMDLIFDLSFNHYAVTFQYDYSATRDMVVIYLIGKRYYE